MEKRNYKLEILDIIETKDWNRAKWSNDKSIYSYILRHKDTDENCKIIWEHISQQSRDYESEVLEIIRTKDWSKAKDRNDRNLYRYIKCHKDTDENCMIIWEYVKPRDHESEILDIIKNEDWNRARCCNDKNLYLYINNHKNTDENCKIIWEHIKTETRNLKSEIRKIVETKDWDRAKGSNDGNLYTYIYRHKNTDEDCKTIWEHIMIRINYTVEDYLLYYFKYGKPTSNNLQTWFSKRIKRNDRPCIDIKNLIIAAETYKDPVAMETLSLIKNQLENKEGD